VEKETKAFESAIRKILGEHKKHKVQESSFSKPRKTQNARTFD
jgi:hypothetical protein